MGVADVMNNAVSRSMKAAQEITESVSRIAEGQSKMRLEEELAPFRIEEAKMKIDAMKQKKEQDDLINAPERIQARLDLETAQEQAQLETIKIQKQQVQDALSLKSHIGEMGKIDEIATTSPKDALSRIDGMEAVLGNNLAFQSWKSGVLAKIAAGKYPDTNKVEQTGTWLIGQYRAGKDISGFRDIAGMDLKERVGVQTATLENTQHIAFVTPLIDAGGDPDEVEKLWNLSVQAENADTKNKIMKGIDTAKRTIGDIKIEGAIREKEAAIREAQQTGKALPFKEDLTEKGSWFGPSNFDKAIKSSLDDFSTWITTTRKATRLSSPLYATLTAKRNRIDLALTDMKYGGTYVGFPEKDREKLFNIRDRWWKALAKKDYTELEKVQEALGSFLLDYSFDRDLTADYLEQRARAEESDRANQRDIPLSNTTTLQPTK
jgi:hypothetical protein